MLNIFITCLVLSVPTEATEIWVSNDGNDNADGTNAKPLKTIVKAVGVSKPGDTVFVRGRALFRECSR